MTCIHHWDVAPAAAVMPAKCKKCGARKEFKSSATPNGGWNMRDVGVRGSVFASTANLRTLAEERM